MVPVFGTISDTQRKGGYGKVNHGIGARELKITVSSKNLLSEVEIPTINAPYEDSDNFNKSNDILDSARQEQFQSPSTATSQTEENIQRS